MPDALARWERDLLEGRGAQPITVDSGRPLTAEQGGFKARQLRCRQIFTKAEEWLRDAEDNDELRDGQLVRFLAILNGLRPTTDPATYPTEQFTVAWEEAVTLLRNRAIGMYDGDESEYCLAGLNDFLVDLDLDSYDPDDDEGEDHPPLTREQARALNVNAEFLPAKDGDEVPAIEVAGVQVSVYVNDNGSLQIAIDLDEADERLQFTNDEVVPMEITIQGGRVYREPNWWWEAHPSGAGPVFVVPGGSR